MQGPVPSGAQPRPGKAGRRGEFLLPVICETHLYMPAGSCVYADYLHGWSIWMRDIRAGVPARSRIAPASSTRQSVPTAVKSARFLSSPRRVGLSTASTASRSTGNPVT